MVIAALGYKNDQSHCKRSETHCPLKRRVVYVLPWSSMSRLRAGMESTEPSSVYCEDMPSRVSWSSVRMKTRLVKKRQTAQSRREKSKLRQWLTLTLFKWMLKALLLFALFYFSCFSSLVSLFVYSSGSGASLY